MTGEQPPQPPKLAGLAEPVSGTLSEELATELVAIPTGPINFGASQPVPPTEAAGQVKAASLKPEIKSTSVEPWFPTAEATSEALQQAGGLTLQYDVMQQGLRHSQTNVEEAKKRFGEPKTLDLGKDNLYGVATDGGLAHSTAEIFAPGAEAVNYALEVVMGEERLAVSASIGAKAQEIGKLDAEAAKYKGTPAKREIEEKTITETVEVPIAKPKFRGPKTETKTQTKTVQKEVVIPYNPETATVVKEAHGNLNAVEKQLADAKARRQEFLADSQKGKGQNFDEEVELLQLMRFSAVSKPEERQKSLADLKAGMESGNKGALDVAEQIMKEASRIQLSDRQKAQGFDLSNIDGVASYLSTRISLDDRLAEYESLVVDCGVTEAYVDSAQRYYNESVQRSMRWEVDADGHGVGAGFRERAALEGQIIGGYGEQMTRIEVMDSLVRKHGRPGDREEADITDMRKDVVKLDADIVTAETSLQALQALPEAARKFVNLSEAEGNLKALQGQRTQIDAKVQSSLKPNERLQKAGEKVQDLNRSELRAHLKEVGITEIDDAVLERNITVAGTAIETAQKQLAERGITLEGSPAEFAREVLNVLAGRPEGEGIMTVAQAAAAPKVEAPPAAPAEAAEAAEAEASVATVPGPGEAEKSKGSKKGRKKGPEVTTQATEDPKYAGEGFLDAIEIDLKTADGRKKAAELRGFITPQNMKDVQAKCRAVLGLDATGIADFLAKVKADHPLRPFLEVIADPDIPVKDKEKLIDSLNPTDRSWAMAGVMIIPLLQNVLDAGVEKETAGGGASH